MSTLGEVSLTDIENMDRGLGGSRSDSPDSVEMRMFPHAVGAPDYATEGAAAIDLQATESVMLYPGQTHLMPTGIAVRMPKHMCAEVMSRSGLGYREDVNVKIGVGLIDSDYHKEIFVPLVNRSTEGEPVQISAGRRIAQLKFSEVIRPDIKMVSSMDDNGRGGFGHTGA